MGMTTIKNTQSKKFMNKKIGAIVIAVALAGATVGCSAQTVPTHSGSKSSHTSQSSTTKPPTSAAVKRAAFEAVITSRLGSGMAKPATAVAKSFCGLIDASPDYTSAVTTEMGLATNDGVSASDLGTIIGAGVPVFCPEHSAEQDAWVATHE